MTAPFCCIADEDTVRGFRLAGVRGYVANTAAEACTALDRVLLAGDCSLLLVSAMVAGQLRGRLEAIRLEVDRPLIAEIPGISGSAPAGKSLQEVMREAVGVRFPTQETK